MNKQVEALKKWFEFLDAEDKSEVLNFLYGDKDRASTFIMEGLQYAAPPASRFDALSPKCPTCRRPL
jgi:hypothetical protein